MHFKLSVRLSNLRLSSSEALSDRSIAFPRLQLPHTNVMPQWDLCFTKMAWTFTQSSHRACVGQRGRLCFLPALAPKNNGIANLRIEVRADMPCAAGSPPMRDPSFPLPKVLMGCHGCIDSLSRSATSNNCRAAGERNVLARHGELHDTANMCSTSLRSKEDRDHQDRFG